MSTLKDMVKGKKVTFSFYREKELWYKTEDGFEFPVPIEDIGGAVFLSEDKALLFMRWIRKHMKTIENARKEQETPLTDDDREMQKSMWDTYGSELCVGDLMTARVNDKK